MKKSRFLLLLIVLSLILPACGQGAAGQSTSGQASSAEQLTWQEQYDLGLRYLSEGNYEEAIIAFTAAIKIDPKQAPAYVGRGDAYVLSGETEENLTAARVDYEKAIELDDTNVNAYLGLADVYIRRGNYDKALEILRQGLEKVKNSEKIAEKINEIENMDPSNLSRYLTDDFISEEEFAIGGIPFYELSIDAVGDLLLSINSGKSWHEYRESSSEYLLLDLLDSDSNVIVSCSQQPSSDTLAYLGYRAYQEWTEDGTIFNFATGIRDIETGDTMDVVLTKLGISPEGVIALVETGQSIFIDSIPGKPRYLSVEEDQGDFIGYINDTPQRMVWIDMGRFQCEMIFIDDRLGDASIQNTQMLNENY